MHNQFFEPLSGQTGDYLAFPGFGFWTRNYAEYLANITHDIPDIVSSPQLFCENIITMLYYHQQDQNPLQNNGSEAVVPNCAPFWDQVSCFPATEAGEQSVIPCPEYILGTAYDTSGKKLIFFKYMYIGMICRGHRRISHVCPFFGSSVMFPSH